jgi:hypothetical protein
MLREPFKVYSAITYSSLQFGNELPAAHTALSAAFIYYVQLLATALLTILKSVSKGAMNILKKPRILLFSVGTGTTNSAILATAQRVSYRPWLGNSVCLQLFQFVNEIWQSKKFY